MKYLRCCERALLHSLHSGHPPLIKKELQVVQRFVHVVCAHSSVLAFFFRCTHGQALSRTAKAHPVPRRERERPLRGVHSQVLDAGARSSALGAHGSTVQQRRVGSQAEKVRKLGRSRRRVAGILLRADLDNLVVLQAADGGKKPRSRSRADVGPFGPVAATLQTDVL